MRTLRHMLLCLSVLVAVSCGDDAGPTAEPVPDASAPTSTTTAPVDAGAGSCGTAEPGPHSIALDAGGATHDVRIFVPSSSGAAPLPAVLNWHGLGGNGPRHAEYTSFETLAEQEGFLVVHATGLESPGLPVLESGLGWELVDALDTPARDDIAFASALIDELIANWCADADRIYSIGMSNGGLFTSTLVCRLSDRLAAAASVAGVYHADTCQPAEPVPYIAFHGTLDDAVPYGADDPTVFPQLRDTIFAAGAFDEFAAFAAGAGCAAEPVPVAISDHVTRHDYQGCAGDTPMSFFTIEGDGHTWPGTPGGSTTKEVDATVASWEFFAQHSRAAG